MKKFPGRTYQGKQGAYLALYNFHPDIWMACPDSLEGRAERLGHATYKYGGYSGGIDFFRLNEKSKIPEIRLQQPSIKLNKRWIKEVDKRQDVQYIIINNTPSEVLDIAREDIRMFVRKAEKKRKKSFPAKNPIGTRINRCSVLIPQTEIKEINRYKDMITTPGKPEFTPQCDNYANIDYSKGCVTSLVFTEQVVWDWERKIAKGIFVAPWHECFYCYAIPNHKSFLKNNYEYEEKSFGQQLKEELLGKAQLITGSTKEFGRRVEKLRFGKRTEAGSLLTRPQFIKTLEICVETETKGVIPTKFLEYNPEVADLLRRTDSVVLYDRGWNEFQKGAVSFGCTTEWAREQAVKYGETGVKTAIYLQIANPVIEPTKRDQEIIRFIEKYKKNLVGVQFLPMRYNSKELAKKIAGINWNDAKSDKILLSNQDPNIGAWELTGRNELIPKKLHPFWLGLIANNNGFYRMCHHTNNYVWCGRCYIGRGLAVKHKRALVNSIKKKPKKKKEKEEKPPTATEKYQKTFGGHV